jgi:hypothetical protein
VDIKRLLSKKGWTGEETGKALILDLINSYKQTLAGSRDPKPLFPPEKITQMLHGFRASRADIEAYNRYINLQNWIMQYQAVANANLQRFNSCFNEFVSIHTAAESAENEYRFIERLPRIITQKQYEELKAKRIEEQLDPKGDGTDAIGDNVFSLILRLIEYYARELEANPKAANPLKAIKKRYSSKAVDNHAYIIGYNKEMGEGYSQLPDGTRSDEVDTETWQARLLHYSPDLQRLKAEAEEGYAGQPGSLSYERLTKEARAAHMGEPKPDEGRSAAIWHVYEEAPEGLTKWELIRADAEGDAYFSEYIPALTGEEITPEAFIADAEAFKKEFPELVEAAFKALDAMGYTYGEEGAEKPLSSIPVSEWETTVFSWRELYNADFPGFRKEIESDYSVFDGDKRALLNGVAVLRPSDFLLKPINGRTCAAIDENGYFKEPEGEALYSNLFGLNAYLPDNPESGDNIDRVERNRATLEESLHFIIGYDAALELIAKEIGIPDFTIFRADGERCLSRTEALNGLFDLLYTHIDEIAYRDKERKAAKLQALRDVFYPIDTKAFTISEARKKKAAEMLEGLQAFGDGRGGNSPGFDFLMLLTGMEGGGDE